MGVIFFFASIVHFDWFDFCDGDLSRLFIVDVLTPGLPSYAGEPGCVRRRGRGKTEPQVAEGRLPRVPLTVQALHEASTGRSRPKVRRRSGVFTLPLCNT